MRDTAVGLSADSMIGSARSSTGSPALISSSSISGK